MMDVLNFTNNAKLSWEDKPRWKKPRKWLGHFADRVTYYGNIMDVLVQHHPEYASLAWGAMKLLFVLVVNHETSVKEIARILSRIADCLPQVDLYSMLYPSDEMRKAVATLYAHILSFLQRAADWYHSSSFSHIIKSFWRPFEVAFKDVVDEICEHGKRVTMLADAGHKQETRMIREILVPVAADVCGLKKLIDIMSGTGKELNIKDGQEQQAYCIQMTQGEFFGMQDSARSVFAIKH
ncbi:hypothetical protein L873DRAFT_1686296 [Choiromyces venosus 120613-1]|uniref:DUF7708 domain-containing protein n=1 Tax=Choiromyces venosus 120613-1 TaxID=1336337 RepID=A0A3N4JKD3_9PEZI|nr:hypothetical protein L873DRAFT_1686296 [Choiromyces venosus 120613-1]